MCAVRLPFVGETRAKKGVTRYNAPMEKSDCPVCLEPVEPHNACRTECGHVFHSACAFRAIRIDRRCSICRQELVKEEPTANDLSTGQVVLEIDGVDLDEFTERIRRLRRNYNARRRRVESRNALLKATKERWKETEREALEATDLYNRQYNIEVKNIEGRLSLRNKKRHKDRQARRERALRTQYEGMLQRVMGETPPSPLEQLLVERLGGDLDI